jgi:hypothetical protein
MVWYISTSTTTKANKGQVLESLPAMESSQSPRVFRDVSLLPSDNAPGKRARKLKFRWKEWALCVCFVGRVSFAVSPAPSLGSLQTRHVLCQYYAIRVTHQVDTNSQSKHILSDALWIEQWPKGNEYPCRSPGIYCRRRSRLSSPMGILLRGSLDKANRYIGERWWWLFSWNLGNLFMSRALPFH